jgi:hypothetical protein
MPKTPHLLASVSAGAVETKNAHDDADLQAIIEACPTLPMTLRAGIPADEQGGVP